jgi:hypothetical protein
MVDFRRYGFEFSKYLLVKMADFTSTSSTHGHTSLESNLSSSFKFGFSMNSRSVHKLERYHWFNLSFSINMRISLSELQICKMREQEIFPFPRDLRYAKKNFFGCPERKRKLSRSSPIQLFNRLTI